MVALSAEEFTLRRQEESVKLAMLFADVVHQSYGIVKRPKIACTVGSGHNNSFHIRLTSLDISAGVVPHTIGEFALNFEFKNCEEAIRWLVEALRAEKFTNFIERGFGGQAQTEFCLPSEIDQVVRVVQLITLAMFKLDPCVRTTRRCPDCRDSFSSPAYLYDDGQILTCIKCKHTFDRSLVSFPEPATV